MINKLMKYGPVQAVTAISVFFLIAIQTRYLSIKEYGLLAIILVIIELSRMFCSQWINAALVRLYPCEIEEKKDEMINVALSIMICFLFLGLNLCFLLLYFFTEIDLYVYVFSVFLLIFKSTLLFFQDLLRLNDDTSKYRKSILKYSFSSIVFTWLFMEYQASLYSALLGLIAANLISIDLMSIKRIRTSKFIFKLKGNGLVLYGLPLMFSGVLMFLTSRVDRLIIGELISLDMLGVYAAISNMLYGIVSLIFMVVALPLYPEMSKVVKDSDKLYLTHQKYLNVLILISIPSFFGLNLIGKDLMLMLLGDKYMLEEYILFYLMSLYTFIYNFKIHFFDHGIQFVSKTKLLPLISMITLAFNVVFIYFFVNLLGVVGAVIGVILSQFISVLITIMCATKHGYSFPRTSCLMNTLISTLFMILVYLFFLKLKIIFTLNFNFILNTFFVILLSISTYMIVHYFLNTLGFKDKLIMIRKK